MIEELWNQTGDRLPSTASQCVQPQRTVMYVRSAQKLYIIGCRRDISQCARQQKRQRAITLEHVK